MYQLIFELCQYIQLTDEFKIRIALNETCNYYMPKYNSSAGTKLTNSARGAGVNYRRL